jgi:hypothetical protein
MLEDKRFDKYMRNMMMVNMQKMMGAQTPMIGDPGMYGGMGAIKEDIDEKTGKVIGRSFVPGAAAGGGGMSDGMLRVIGEQNKILLQSQMDQLREMKGMFNSVLRNSQNNQNPLAIIEQFKNAGLIPDPAKQQAALPESIESINARLDAQVKLLTVKMEMEKTRHDWNIQREDKIAQSENTKEWVGTIKDIIEHSVKPTLGEFAKGYGEAMARQKFEAEQQKMAAVQQAQMARRVRAAAMNRQQMGGGVMPPQQQQQQQRPYPPQQQQFYRQQVQQVPPQQQQAYYPQEEQQQPSRHQQEMQRNIINEEKITQMSMEEIDQVEEEILYGISQARPLYQRLELEKQKRRAAIASAANKQQPQPQQQAQESQQQPQQQERGNESKPAPESGGSMDFGVSVGSE